MDSNDDIFEPGQDRQFFDDSDEFLAHLPISPEIALDLLQFYTIQSVSSENQMNQLEINDEKIEINQQIQQSNLQRNRENGRVTNNIFKTSLGQFRKSILDIIKKAPNLLFLKKQINNIYKVKNQSVFPKLLSMVRELGIKQQISQIWAIRVNKLLQKKRLLLQIGRYQKNRLQELQKQIERFEKSFNEIDFQKAFDIYWGRYKQHQKYERCKKQVFEFNYAFADKVRLIREQQTRVIESKKKTKSNYEGEKNKKINTQK